jgi:hypothetical protein
MVKVCANKGELAPISCALQPGSEFEAGAGITQA